MNNITPVNIEKSETIENAGFLPVEELKKQIELENSEKEANKRVDKITSDHSYYKY